MVSEVVPADQLLDARRRGARAIIASQPKLAIEGTVRAIWGAREFGSATRCASATPTSRMGTSQDSIAEGQKLFESGKRIEWRAALSACSADKRVAIVGAALSDCGRVDDKTAVRAALPGRVAALADAGPHQGRRRRVRLVRHGHARRRSRSPSTCGLRPTWVDGTGVGGATWEFMVEHAVAAIQAGHVETVVLAYGSTTRADLKRKRRSANLAFGGARPDPVRRAVRPHADLEVRDGDAPAHDRVRHHDRAAGRDRGVDARYNASFNPEAYYRDPITIDDVQSSRMIADPFTKLHCCIRSDGGGAIVLTSEERARDLAKTPVLRARHGRGGVAHDDERVGRLHRVARVRGRAQLAFERAGVTPADIDCCQFYDAFTGMVLLTLEALGFCAKGEGGAVRRGRQAAPRRRAAHEHRRRRPVGVPPRDARHVPARRGVRQLRRRGRRPPGPGRRALRA